MLQARLMFTGIIENQAKVTQVGAHKLLISNPFSSSLSVGQSIAIDGCCLTVVSTTPQEIAFDLSKETLNRTYFRNLKTGATVNLEKGVKAGDPLDGHWVTGHVDGIGTVQKVTQDDVHMKTITIQVASRFLPWIIEKGSISVNGVSLTVNQLLPNGFEVALIPHTLKITNLRYLKEGDKVNLEFDILAKYIERMMHLKEVQA